MSYFYSWETPGISMPLIKIPFFLSFASPLCYYHRWFHLHAITLLCLFHFFSKVITAPLSSLILQPRSTSWLRCSTITWYHTRIVVPLLTSIPVWSIFTSESPSILLFCSIPISLLLFFSLTVFLRYNWQIKIMSLRCTMCFYILCNNYHNQVN